MNSSVSIIGLGNMASALAQRATAGGNAVEIIGRNPQRIVLLAGASGADSADVGDAHPERFVALFLPECNLIGMKPARTLLVPACEYAAGRVMTMLSTTKESVIRLGEALDQQPDFVWTNYETI